MNKEIKEKWIAALRSGNYKQGIRRLRTINDEYCCLGVLCDIMEIPATISNRDFDSCYGYDGEVSVLPKSITLKTGVDTHGRFRNDDDKEELLTKLNDEGKNFKEIADVIERYF
jgi:hypothetical protein